MFDAEFVVAVGFVIFVGLMFYLGSTGRSIPRWTTARHELRPSSHQQEHRRFDHGHRLSMIRSMKFLALAFLGIFIVVVVVGVY